MQIIVLEDEPSSFRGGQELSLLDVCRGLAQRGHQIYLLYVTAGNLLQQYQEFCTKIVKVDGYDLDRRRLTHIFNFFTDIWQVSLSKTEKNIVYSNRYWDVLFGSLLAKSKNIPLVCHLRLPPPPQFGRPHTIGLKGVNQFIAISEQTKSDWVEFGFPSEKIDVVYNAINSEIFKPLNKFTATRKALQISKYAKVITYVGRLDVEKGLETLIKAFALIHQRDPETQLLIAGKPLSTQAEYKQTLVQLASDRGVESDVKFLGHVADTVSLYQASDVTVLPSTWSEPFGRTVIESMACGIPVVASQIGGIPEILTGEFQTGLFEPKNEQDLAQTLIRVLKWREREPQLGERCREHVLAKFTLARMVDGIEKVLWGVTEDK